MTISFLPGPPMSLTRIMSPIGSPHSSRRRSSPLGHSPLRIGPSQEYLIPAPVYRPYEAPDGPVSVQVTLKGVPFLFSEDAILANLADNVEFCLAKPIPTFDYTLKIFTSLVGNGDASLRAKDGPLSLAYPGPSKIVGLPEGRHVCNNTPQDDSGRQNEQR
jgi:hypothetical protein